MKKLFVGCSAVILAGALVGATACGGGVGGNNYSIPGKYTAATNEELAAELSKIDMEGLLGDPTAEDYSLGISFGAKLREAGLSASVDVEGMRFDISTEESLEANYDILIRQDSLAGAGSYKAEMNLEANGLEQLGAYLPTGETTNDMSVYNDADYLYVKQNKPMKNPLGVTLPETFKVSFNEIIGDAFGEDVDVFPDEKVPAVPDTGVDSGDDDLFGDQIIGGVIENGITAESVDEVLFFLNNTMGCQVQMDNSDGLKLKLSASEKTVWALINMFLQQESFAPGTVADGLEDYLTISYKNFKFDFYVDIGSDGLLREVSIDFDVDAHFALHVPEDPEDPESLSGDMIAVTGDFVLRGGLGAEIKKVQVKLPAELQNYPVLDETSIMIPSFGY